MNWKLIETLYDGVCSSCGKTIDERTPAYYRREDASKSGVIVCTQCYKQYGVNNDTQRNDEQRTTTTTPTPTAPSREQAIAKAHAENMEANQSLVLQLSALTAAIVDLMRVEADRNALLKQGLKT